MARFAYFSDLPNGEVLEWRDTAQHYEDARGMARTREVAAKVGYREGKLHGYDAARGWVLVTRQIEMKAQPTRHECDDRCVNASGRIMKCECSCGGKNHGRGAFMCEAA